MKYPKNLKLNDPTISSAKGYLEHIKATLKLPSKVIMCPVSGLTKTVEHNYKTKHYKLDGDIYMFDGYDACFVTNFGMGAPAYAMMAEVIIGLGAKEIILCGYAGTLQKNMNVGDIILCTKALSDEGTSPHYDLKEDFSHPSEELNDKLRAAFKALNTDFKEGPTWTTDALFRETQGEVAHYQKNGIMSVEMEASAAFSIAAFYGVKCSAVFAVSDILANLKWETHFGAPEIHTAMRKILEASLKA
ncbi:Phosphorylase superfamily protein [Parelusimicrobium proximum]|uniref:nucleoside phosphorylase n=1 Tax=Parelusimicrobium proximum TaxID=3228953 RepID=UPI003D169DE6